jgi:septum formation protein
MKQLILASQSPRRSEILKKAGYQFVSLPVHVSEIPNKNLNLDEQIIDIARRKANACAELPQAQGRDAVIVSADTLVCLGEETLGKPENERMAFEYLSLLSGRAHQVKTAVCLLNKSDGNALTHLETTQIFFRHLTEKEIWDYIKTGEPMDKAGAYGIQGLGGKFVEKYEGDFNNVVGLPLQALENLFKINAWTFPRLQPDP